MNDEETVALIAGGHSFGKTHGAGPATHVGPEPEAAPLEAQGLGWKSSYGTGKGGDAITSGLEVTWTTTPTKWSHDFFENLFGYEWELTKSPAGAHQWTPKNGAGDGTVPDAHDPSKTSRAGHADDRPRAAVRPGLREDLAALLRAPGGVRRRLRQGVVQADAPRHGATVALPRPAGAGRAADVAGPGPAGRPRADRRDGHRGAQGQILASGLSVSQLVSTAWASASTFRGTDKRGGANGARIRLAPQKDWAVNNPPELADGAADARGHPAGVQRRAARRQEGGLAGRPDRAGRLRRGRAGGKRRPATTCRCPSRRAARMRRRSRPTWSRSPCSSRRPTGSATTSARGSNVPAERLLVDRALLLTLSAPEMTVLVGGLRVLGANGRPSTSASSPRGPGR